VTRYYAVVRLAFATKSLRQLCESQVRAERRFGVHAARTLQHRLADLMAAENATDIIAGQPRIVAATPHQRMVVQLTRKFEIVLSANHNSVPTLKDGAVDWSSVTRVQILSIEEVARA
jgi:hypothetical protein